MIKVKDGYAKLIGTTYKGAINHVLLSNGGNLPYSTNKDNNTLVLRNNNGLIYATHFNSIIGDDALTDIGSIYVRNTSDTFIRRVSKSLFYSIIDDKFVTLDTNQTITGVKAFFANLILGKDNTIFLHLLDTSNYTPFVAWYKGGIPLATYNPQIGLHNVGGDGSGSITILPYATESKPWDKMVGLYVAKNTLLLEGKPIALAENCVTMLGTSGNNLTWTKNGVTNNIIVPYSYESSCLGINNGVLENRLQFMQRSNGWNTWDAPKQNWFSVLKLNHGNGNTYYNRVLAFDFFSHAIYTNYMENGNTHNWAELLTTANYASTLDSRYVNVTGDTMTGRLTINASGENLLYINTTNAHNYITYASNNVNKGHTGYYNGFAMVANAASGGRIGVNDAGNPEYWPDYSGNTKYTLWHDGNWTSALQTVFNTKKALDLRSYDSNKWYPCWFYCMHGYPIHVWFFNCLDGIKPAWATHNSGFSLAFDFVTWGASWGAISAWNTLYYHTALWGGETALGGFEQNTMASVIIIWLRGGALYHYWASQNIYITSNPNGYSWSSSGASFSRAPRTTQGNPFSGVHYNALTSSTVAAANKLATARTIWGQSFDGTGNVDGNLTCNGKIYCNNFAISNAATNTIAGISLYGGGSADNYGIYFAHMSYAAHGYLGANDWRTYFSMARNSASENRGWIFRDVTYNGNVFSIDTNGNAYANGNFNANILVGRSYADINNHVIVNGAAANGSQPYIVWHIPNTCWTQIRMDGSGNLVICDGGNQSSGYKPLYAGYLYSATSITAVSGFSHGGVNSNDYVLLAGGGYKAISDFTKGPVVLSSGTVINSAGNLTWSGVGITPTITRNGPRVTFTLAAGYHITSATVHLANSSKIGGATTSDTAGRGSGATWFSVFANNTNYIYVLPMRLGDGNNDSWGSYASDWTTNAISRLTVTLIGY